LRIVFDGRYIQDCFPGIGRYAYNLVKALGDLETGDEIVVLASPRIAGQRYDLAALTSAGGLRLVDCPIPRYLPAEALSLARFVNRLKPDVFHSPFFLRPYPLSCPCAVTLHDVIPLDFPGGRGRLADNLVFRLGARLACRSSAIITSSGASAAEVAARFRVPEKKVHSILLAPDPNFTRQPEDRITAMRQKYSLSSPYVLYVGSFLPHKNVAGLLEAWACLRQFPGGAGAGHRLVLAGCAGEFAVAVRKLVEKLGLEPSVDLIGTVDESLLSVLYSGADLFVFPSLAEGYGFPVIEAMACGTAVVCSDIPSLREVTAGAAVLTDPRNPEQIAESMRLLLADHRLRKDSAQKGIERLSQSSWRDTALKTHAAYRQMHAAGRIVG